MAYVTNARRIPISNTVHKDLPAFHPTATLQSLRASAVKEFARNSMAKKADHQVRRDHLKRRQQLRSSNASNGNAKSAPNPLSPSYSDAEGLARARELLPKDAPPMVFNLQGLEKRCRWYGHHPRAHQLVKENAFANSTFVNVVDLRDDEARAPNGATIRRGAIYEDGEVAAGISTLSVQIYVEMTGNRVRAVREMERVARICTGLRTLRIEIIGADNLTPAVEIVAYLRASQASWAGEKPAFSVAYSASRYDEE